MRFLACIVNIARFLKEQFLYLGSEYPLCNLVITSCYGVLIILFYFQHVLDKLLNVKKIELICL